MLRSASLPYRLDIDGLRAVAVMAVVAYHAGINVVSGGYVGVDVFFVISGFLIGSVIDKSCAEGNFSFRDFYERRVRRIAPALLFMLAATLMLAYAVSMPAEMVEAGRTAVAALLSVSNVCFWWYSGYFDVRAEAQPFLHTWSLSIEEQFYLLLPLGLVAAYRWFPRWRRPVIGAAALLSLLASTAAIGQYPTASFYLLPTRAWELLLGVLVGLYEIPLLTRRSARNAVAALGAAMIGAAVLAYTPRTPFPGYAALLPCLGAACIIAAGRAGPTAVGRLLSAKPVVFVGLISYSLYLWHWPIIVFQRSDAFLVAGAGPALETLAVIAASVVMGTLSWRFVERPFRSRERVTRARLFRTVGGAAALVGVVGLAAVASDGYAWRLPPEVREIVAYLDYNPRKQYRTGTCMISSGFGFRNYRSDLCLARSDSERNYLLIGDSHAAHLWHGLDHALPQANVMQATASGCRPTLKAEAGSWVQCRLVIDHVLQDYLALHPVDALLIAAKWTEGDLPAIGQTLDWVQGRGIKVILFGPIVQYDTAVPRLVANSARFGEDLLARHRLTGLKQLDDKLRALAQAKGVHYVSLWDVMCRHERCLATTVNGRPLQFDYGHVTEEGSRTVVKLAIAGTLIDEGVR